MIELRRVAPGEQGDTLTYLAENEALARKVVDDVHLYLKFVGDEIDLLQ